MKLAPSLLASLVLLALVTERQADACCGVGYGLGQRLAPMEDAALSASGGWSGRFATWTREQRLTPMPAGAREQSSRLEVSGVIRVARRWQLGLSVPALRNARAYGGLATSAAGVGDATATARFDLIPVAGADRPLAIALLAAAMLPTGTPAARSRDPLGADITGLGTAEARPGIALETISQQGWYAAASFTLGLRAPHQEQGHDVRLAPRFYGIAVAGKTIGQEGSLSAGLISEREGAARIDGQRVASGGRSRTAVTTMGAAPLADRLWLTGVFLIDIPLAGVGRNEALTASMTLGLRMSFL